MIKTTHAQRVALKRVFDRCPVYVGPNNALTSQDRTGNLYHYGPIPYREFRKRAVQFDYDAVGIQWCGMWLGIETDGYTHS